jgi:hypothetical protein
MWHPLYQDLSSEFVTGPKEEDKDSLGHNLFQCNGFKNLTKCTK